MSRSRSYLTALLVSLSLHGLLTVCLVHLPGRGAPPVRPATAVVDPTDDGDDPSTVSFLVEPPRRRQPAPAPATPAPLPLLAPMPPPVELDPLEPPPPIVQAAYHPQPRAMVDAGPPGAAPASALPGLGQGRAATSFFQVPAQGQKVVYVIDRSASMGLNRALAVARQELLASLEQLPPTAYFQVIVYNQSAETLVPGSAGWLPATVDNKRLAAAALNELRPEGATRHELALPRALALQPDAVYFLTDADDLPPEHLRLVTQRNAGRAVIHVVELNVGNRNRPDMPLQKLARDNRGLYQAVDLHAYR